MTRILVVKEKHGSRYFEATTEEQLYKIALYLLKGRFNEGYWYSEPEFVEPLDFTEADIANMPQSMQDGARRQLRDYQHRLRVYLEDKEEWDKIKEAIENNDGKLAFSILDGRSGYEYEGFDIEECEEIT